ncbi:MAG: hypothetical protein OXG10_01760 [Candidatus Dadabacteria bacterium]|nr:hypothetical protein [Candidatus Dadabacteria bacterium]
MRKCAEFREDGYQYAYVDEGLEVEKLMELARVLRENLWDREIEKVRIDIELAADCGCIQHIDEPPPPVKEDDNDQTQKETQRD